MIKMSFLTELTEPDSPTLKCFMVLETHELFQAIKISYSILKVPHRIRRKGSRSFYSMLIQQWAKFSTISKLLLLYFN